jgi:AcrR family transcriptional regulator
VSTSKQTRTAKARFRRRPPDQYHHGDLRQALLDAALRLVERRGPDGFTLREAARVVGVTHTAPYRHFADKAALLAAVAHDGAVGMRDAMAKAVAGIADPAARLQALGVAYVTYAVEHPSHFKVMYGRELDRQGALGEVKQQKMAMLVESVIACQRVSVLPPGPPEPLALVCWSMVHGLATLINDGLLEHGKLVTGRPVDVATAVTRQLLVVMAGGGRV